MSNKAAIKDLKSKIRKAKRTLKRAVRKANKDDIVTPSEQTDIDFIEQTIADLEQQLEVAEGKLIVVDFSEEEADTIVVVNWGETSDIRLHFNSQMQDWIVNVRAELNAVHSQYNDTEQEVKFGLDDALSIASLIPVVGAYAGTLSTIKGMTEKVLKASVSSSKVTFNQLHSDMDDAMSKYAAKDYDKEFDAFQKDFEKAHENYTQDDVLKAVTALKKKLPIKAMGQQLVKQLLDNVPDKTWDGNDYAGVLEMEIQVHIPVIRGDYSFHRHSGYIDDANQALLNAVKHSFKGKRAIELPIPIIITLVDPFNRSATICKIKRSSKKPGNNDFKLIESPNKVQGPRCFKAMMDQGAHYDLSVKKLKVE